MGEIWLKLFDLIIEWMQLFQNEIITAYGSSESVYNIIVFFFFYIFFTHT